MIKTYAFADEASPMMDDQIKAMKRNGLDGLEIRGVDGQPVLDISLDKAKEVKAKLDAAGLVTWSVGSSIGKIGIEDNFEQHLDKLKWMLEIAHTLDAENIRMFSFFIPKDHDPAEYKGEVIDRLGRFAEAAKGSGIHLCHENEKGIYGDTAARCLEILKAVPSLKFVFDPANFVQCRQDTATAWELLGDRVFYMHIKDAREDGFVVPAGNGVGNVPAIVKAFIEKGGRNFTIEPHLTVFKGLAALENEGEKSVIDTFKYPDADTAFDAACNAFRGVMK
ncbi:MAG: sugar phosphate isomerase/epimerase [Clostridia bacterium]|nr:sugar phosphate isomerase/epimerase [Clostridia bacterium]